MIIITLGGLSLNKDLYLDGLVNAKNISVSKVRTLGGVSDTRTMTQDGGRPLLLTTLSDPLQGIFCQSQVDAIKAMETAGVGITLTYRDSGDFLVLIVGTNFRQFNQREPIGPNKKYTGSIQLTEV